MKTHILFLSMVLSTIILTSPLPAQISPSLDPTGSTDLYLLARNILSPIELQSLGFLEPPADPSLTQHQLRQACLLLEAATELDPSNSLAWNELVDIYTSDTIDDPNRAENAVLMYRNLNPLDHLPITSILDYYLSNFNDLDSRQTYLLEYVNDPYKNSLIQNYSYIYSQILTQLGKYAREKGLYDDETPPSPDEPLVFGARSLFNQALSVWSYNDQALAYLLTLPLPEVSDPEGLLTPEQIAENQTLQLQQFEYDQALRWRLRLLGNPHDLPAALELINILNQLGKHDLAQDYYAHAHLLLTSVPRVASLPNAPALLQEVLTQQLLACYTNRDFFPCINLVQALLETDPQSFMLNALLGRSLSHLNSDREAEQIFKQITSSTFQKLADQETPNLQLLNDLAWFYGFVDPDPNLVLTYAQIAHQQQPNPSTNDALAYALLLNGQIMQAENLLSGSDPNSLIAPLTRAKIAQIQGNEELAREFLHVTETSYENQKYKSPIQAALFYDHIAQLRQELQQLKPPETTETDIDPFTETFHNQFSGNDLLMAAAPEKAVQFSLKFSSDLFNYGDPMMARLHLVNISNHNNIDTELLLGPGNFIDPHVIITAEIKSTSDANGSTGVSTLNPDSQPIYLTYRYLMQKPILLPGQSNSISETLNISSLRKILQRHPQQEYSITFRAYIDPVTAENNAIYSNIPAIQSNPVTVIRKAFIPTPVRLEAMTRTARFGTAREQINATRLLAALIKEAELARSGILPYHPQYIDTEPLKQIIIEKLTHADDRVRGWSVYALREMSLTPGSTLVRRMSEILSEPSDATWFARFMTIQVLNPIADLTDYLSWASRVEQNPLLIRQIQLYQNLPWQNNDMPAP